ncbi:hypothetical protein ACHAXM_008509 [Skeletonema potamos]|jgi:hypothetical protein
MKNLIAPILAAFLVSTTAAADADAHGNRQLTRKKASNAEKSYSYFTSMSKASKGTKASKGGKGSKGFSCQKLTFAACVIYIVKVGVENPFVWQDMNGELLGLQFATEDEAIEELKAERKYVEAPAKDQGKYSICWEGTGTLMQDPVYFPNNQQDCGEETLIRFL